MRYGQNEDPKRLLSRTQEVSAAFLYKCALLSPITWAHVEAGGKQGKDCS